MAADQAPESSNSSAREAYVWKSSILRASRLLRPGDAIALGRGDALPLVPGYAITLVPGDDITQVLGDAITLVPTFNGAAEDTRFFSPLFSSLHVKELASCFPVCC